MMFAVCSRFRSWVLVNTLLSAVAESAGGNASYAARVCVDLQGSADTYLVVSLLLPPPAPVPGTFSASIRLIRGGI